MDGFFVAQEPVVHACFCLDEIERVCEEIGRIGIRAAVQLFPDALLDGGIERDGHAGIIKLRRRLRWTQNLTQCESSASRLCDYHGRMTVDMLRGLSASKAEKLSPLMRAMWCDAQGDWEGAHALAQDMPGRDGARVHAYLHRKEGDEWNAGYWYRQAGAPVFQGTLEEEWGVVVGELLGHGK